MSTGGTVASLPRAHGHNAICRLRIKPTSSAAPLFVDVYTRVTQELVEAKATVRREDIRMAVGQIADYRRYVKGAACYVLLPDRLHQVRRRPRGRLLPLAPARLNEGSPRPLSRGEPFAGSARSDDERAAAAAPHGFRSR